MADSQIFCFEGFELDLARNCLVRDGEEVHLRQKAFSVLVRLVEQRARLVTKDELFESVWENAAVTDDVLVQCITEIRRSLGDDPHSPRFIKTVPKTGYRFIGRVNEKAKQAEGGTITYTEEVTRIEYDLEEETRTEEIVVSDPEARRGLGTLLPSTSVRFLLATAAAIVITAGAGSYLGYFSISPAANVSVPVVPGRTAVAVMFFENRSSDAELDWLREGLADMLISKLSQSDKLTLLSRGQLQALIGRNPGAATDENFAARAISIGQKAGVDSVVIGSFARLGQSIRVDVNLLDATTGALKASESLTVERPEKVLTEIDMLSLRLLRRLTTDGMPNQATLSRSMTANLEAYRSYSLALEKAKGLDAEQALRLLERAVELDPEFAMAHARIGHTYAITWAWAEKARPHLEKAFILSDRLSEKDRLQILAWYSIANQDFPEAIDYYRELVSRYPLDDESHHRLGNLLRGENRVDEAISVYKEGLAIDPESPGLHNALGLTYSERGQHDDAIAMHERYVSLAPDLANAHDSLGMSLQWAGRYEESLASFNRAIELDPSFEIPYSHRGVTYYRQGRYEQAIESFDKYIEIAPSALERARGLSYKAHIHMARGNDKTAEHLARRAAAENPANGWPAVVLAIKRGNRSEAKRLEAGLLEVNKFTGRGRRVGIRPIIYYRGFVELKTGDPNKAIETIKESLTHAPMTWDIDPFEDALAKAYLETGRYQEAIVEFERVLPLNPNYPLALYYLGSAYRALGQNTKAKECFLKFLEVWKEADADIPEIVAARREIG